MTESKPRVISGQKLVHDWTPQRSKHFAKTKVFGARIDYIKNPDGRLSDYYILECPTWVNVVATTPENEIVLIRQWRVGVKRQTLEIPGGMVDPGEDSADAAARELREETGYVSDHPPELIGKVDTNPALFDNETHTYLIRNAEPTGKQQLDSGEQIQVELFPAVQVGELIDSGHISHSLVVAALHFFARKTEQ